MNKIKIKRIAQALAACFFANLLIFASFTPAYANTTATATLSLTTSTVMQSTGSTSYLGVPINLALTNISTTQKVHLATSQTVYSGKKGACTGTSGISKTTTNFCMVNSHSDSPIAGDFDVTATLTYTDANGQTQTLSPSISFSVDPYGELSLINSTPDSRIADQTAPTISIRASTSAPTNRQVVLSAIANDDTTPIDEILYSVDNQLTWSSDNSLTVKENGIYTFFAKDLVGNISSASYDVENIDTTAPTAMITTQYNSANNTVTATLVADEPIMAPNGWATDSGNEIFTKIFAKNQIVPATLFQDLAGNLGAANGFTINQIDETPPTISGINFAKNYLSGIVDDPNATISIVINGRLYLISPNHIANGTWMRSFAKLPNGKYEAKIFATDQWNNVSMPIFANFTVNNPVTAISSLNISRNLTLTGKISPPTSDIEICAMITKSIHSDPTQSFANLEFLIASCATLIIFIAAALISLKFRENAKM